jgi:hypothetical protein
LSLPLSKRVVLPRCARSDAMCSKRRPGVMRQACQAMRSSTYRACASVLLSKVLTAPALPVAVLAD